MDKIISFFKTKTGLYTILGVVAGIIIIVGAVLLFQFGNKSEQGEPQPTPPPAEDIVTPVANVDNKVYIYAGSGFIGENTGTRLKYDIVAPAALWLDESGRIIVDCASGRLAIDGDNVVPAEDAAVVPKQEVDLSKFNYKGYCVVGDVIYAADPVEHVIRMINLDKSTNDIVAGTGEAGNISKTPSDSQFNRPSDVLFNDGKLYIADTNNNRIKVVSVGALAPITQQAEVIETARTVTLFKFTGTAEVESLNGTVIPAYEDMRLKQGDIIRTAADSTAFLDIDGDKVVSMDADTTIELSTLKGNKKNQRTVLTLLKGRILNNVTKLENDSTYNVATSVATMGVRGTIFSVQLSPNATSTSEPILVVVDGEVMATIEIINPDGSAEQPEGTPTNPMEQFISTREDGAIVIGGDSVIGSLSKADFVNLLQNALNAISEHGELTQGAGTDTPAGQSELIKQLANVMSAVMAKVSAEVPALAPKTAEAVAEPAAETGEGTEPPATPAAEVPTRDVPASSVPASSKPASSAPPSSKPASSTPPTSEPPTSAPAASEPPASSAPVSSQPPASSAPTSSQPPASSTPVSSQPVSSESTQVEVKRVDVSGITIIIPSTNAETSEIPVSSISMTAEFPQQGYLRNNGIQNFESFITDSARLVIDDEANTTINGSNTDHIVTFPSLAGFCDTDERSYRLEVDCKVSGKKVTLRSNVKFSLDNSIIPGMVIYKCPNRDGTPTKPFIMLKDKTTDIPQSMAKCARKEVAFNRSDSAWTTSVSIMTFRIGAVMTGGYSFTTHDDDGTYTCDIESNAPANQLYYYTFDIVDTIDDVTYKTQIRMTITRSEHNSAII